MKVETTLPLQKEARILQFTKDESLASFQWCFLRIAYKLQLSFDTYFRQTKRLPDKIHSLTAYLIVWGRKIVQNCDL